MPTFHVIEYDSVGSTSDEALRLARRGAAHGTVVTAREQTAGRGRAGRKWDSPPGNLYLSVLLRLDLPPARIAELSFVAALAVADMVDAVLPGSACLKWPNDVLVEGAKVAGILVEQIEGVVIAGIGVNIAHSPSGTAYLVTSLVGRASLTVAQARDLLLAVLSRRLDAWLAGGFPPIRADWLARAHPPGTALRAGSIDGTFVTLDADGALLLDTKQGRRRVVAGEVQPR